MTNAKHARGFSWESRHKYSPLSAEYDGYSSEASAEDGRLRLCEQNLNRKNLLPVQWLALWPHSKTATIIDLNKSDIFVTD